MMGNIGLKGAVFFGFASKNNCSLVSKRVTDANKNIPAQKAR